MRCQALRVLIIDESSMVCAELLGTLQDVMSKVVRWRGIYRRRKNKTEKVFGGVSLIMLADFWQLPPDTGTYLCDNSTRPTGPCLQCNANFFGKVSCLSSAFDWCDSSFEKNQTLNIQNIYI